MKYKVYDGITKNLSDVTLNTMDDAERRPFQVLCKR